VTLQDVVFKRYIKDNKPWSHIINTTSFSALIDYSKFILRITQGDLDWNPEIQFEVAVYSKEYELIELPGVTDKPIIRAWLSFKEVDAIIRKLEFEVMTTDNFKPVQLN
jgi:hypothetical protein